MSSVKQPPPPLSTSTAAPRVLFIDDSDQVDPAQLRNLLEPYGVEARLRHPEVAIRNDLDWANLIVVDYFLTFWPERDEVESVARRPCDGLAAAASMRSVLLPSLTERLPGALPSRSVAFAMWSSNLKEATFDLPQVVLPHVFARENNLEWAFGRDELLDEQGDRQIAILARAAASLPEQWPSEPSGAEEQMLIMLGIMDAEDSER
jgi:hypothetical protein